MEDRSYAAQSCSTGSSTPSNLSLGVASRAE